MIARSLLLLAAAAQTAAPLPTPVANGGEVTVGVRFLGGRQARPLPFEVVNGSILFRATIGGHDGWMLLDNGTERSTVDRAFAEQAGLAVDRSRTGVTHLPGGGSLPTSTVGDTTLLLPGQMEARTPLVAADLSGLARTYARPVAGILGGDFLDRLEMQIDPGNRTLVLRPSGTAVPAPSIPSVALTGRPPRLTVTIEGKPVTLMLDLGLNAGLVLSRAAWARVKPAGVATRPITAMAADGVAKVADAAVLPAMQMGPATVHQVRVGILDLPIAGADGALGYGALGNLIIVLDIGAGRMWFAPRLPAATGARP